MDDPSEPSLQHVRCFQDEQRGEREYRALGTPGDLLPVAAGGPAGGFGAVIPPWLGDKSRAVTLAVGACLDCEAPADAAAGGERGGGRR